MTQDSELQPLQPTRSLKNFGPLIGSWSMVGTHPAFPSSARGKSSFDWLLEDALLIWHFDWEVPGPPSAISVIGRDDPAETYSMLYADERGVGRIYQMTLEGGVWKIWRNSPGFSQRMTGTFGNGGNTIYVHGELSRDDANWEPDLAVTYTRME